MDPSERWLCFAVAVIVLLIGALFYPVFAHEHGRTDRNWEQMSNEEREWIKSLKMADSPTQSCCGVADQYWCDGVKVEGDKAFCQITDDRPDDWFIGPTGYSRPHVPVGTWIELPPEKVKFGPNDPQKASNPTGHNIVFMSASHFVYCFVMATGI